MKIIFHHQDINKFIESLENNTISKVLRVFDLLLKYGCYLGMPHSKKIHNQLFELRIRGKQEVRFLYTFMNDKVIILHAFLKKSNKIPRKDLSIAEKRRMDL